LTDTLLHNSFRRPRNRRRRTLHLQHNSNAKGVKAARGSYVRQTVRACMLFHYWLFDL